MDAALATPRVVSLGETLFAALPILELLRAQEGHALLETSRDVRATLAAVSPSWMRLVDAGAHGFVARSEQTLHRLLALSAAAPLRRLTWYLDNSVCAATLRRAAGAAEGGVKARTWLGVTTAHTTLGVDHLVLGGPSGTLVEHPIRVAALRPVRLDVLVPVEDADWAELAPRLRHLVLDMGSAQGPVTGPTSPTSTPACTACDAALVPHYHSIRYGVRRTTAVGAAARQLWTTPWTFATSQWSTFALIPMRRRRLRWTAPPSLCRSILCRCRARSRRWSCGSPSRRCASWPTLCTSASCA